MTIVMVVQVREIISSNGYTFWKLFGNYLEMVVHIQYLYGSAN